MLITIVLTAPHSDGFDWRRAGATVLVEQYHSMGIGISRCSGLTETCGPACLMDAENSLKHPASTGKAFFHTEVKIADDDGFYEVPRGTPEKCW